MTDQVKRQEAPNRPEHWWEYILAFMGFPVRAGGGRIEFPWVTYGIVALCCIVSILAWQAPDFKQIVKNFGMTKETVQNTGGLSLITAFFLHANWKHLLSNMYFLALFGGKTEQYLGRRNYLLLLASATLVGHVAHLAFDPRTTVPSIGASGGIAGVIVFYCLKYPKDQFYQFVGKRFIKISAFFYMAAWIAMQFAGVGKELQGMTNVSAFAHLGGALMGLLSAVAWPVSQQSKEELTEKAASGE